MKAFEIYTARVNYRNCVDMRPWIIFELRPGGVLVCFPISTKCYDGDCFELLPERAEFAATGLARASFILFAATVELLPEQLIKLKGDLRGELLHEFRIAAGI